MFSIKLHNTMSYGQTFRVLFLLPAVFFLVRNASAQNALRLSPQNHHYLEYKNRPCLLITSAEHYGALMNTGFNYIAYLDALHKNGMNNTRVFSGSYVERRDDIKFMQYGNTLAPRQNKLIAPWKRSNVPGYINGGNKFDLDNWDDNYFIRLTALVEQAARRNIMIELTLFGNQYSDGIYQYSPLYPDNNIQGIGLKGKNSFLDFQSLKDSGLVAKQDAMVIKIVTEMNSYGNLYYEISNEPYNEVKDSSVIDRWHDHMVRLIRQTERSLPVKHLIASNQAIVDNKDVDIANYHYVHISNMPDHDSLLSLNKVISMDETMGSLYDADVNDVRVEAWDFILRGGGAYDNLSWEYTPQNPAGTPGADTIRQYLQNLQRFMGRFDFVRMKFSVASLVQPPKNAIIRILEEKGKQYAVYIHHGKPNDMVFRNNDFVSKYEADEHAFRDTFTLQIPEGRYTIRWYNTVKGNWIGKGIRLNHKGGNYTLHTPLFTTDIALEISAN